MINNEFAQQEMIDMFERKDGYTDVVFLYGTLNSDIVNSTLRIIDQKLNQLNCSRSLISRTKLVGVELMENIHKHQTKSSTIAPYFLAVLDEQGLNIYAGNSISPNDHGVLSEKLRQYSEMSLDELKKLYVQRLSQEKIDSAGNMGVGLITIMNRARKRTTHQLVKVSDNEYFFKMQVNISSADDRAA